MMLVLPAAALLALLLAADAVPVPDPAAAPAPPAPSVRGGARAGGARGADRDVTVSKYSNKPNSGSGEYSYGFELSDGSSRYEEGRLKGMPGREYLVVSGSFSRPRFDGTMEQVMYYADEGGFHVAKMVPGLGQTPSSALVASLVG